MMSFWVWGVVVAVGAFALDQLGLWMERRGWLYYRHRKPTSGSGMGNALMEFNALMNPSAREVVEVKKQQSPRADDQAEGGGRP